MSLQVLNLLAEWHPQRDQCDWVLGTVFDTAGPVYRHAGALMLFGGDGQQLGLLSGGCLEAEIGINARKVMASGQSQTLTYDGSDEDDIAFRLGIGCGGSIQVLLQKIAGDNEYLGLLQVYALLQERRPAILCQRLPQLLPGQDRAAPALVINPAQAVAAGFEPVVAGKGARLETLQGEQWFINPLWPAPALLVVGGGVDARPLVEMAATLGWHVLLCDSRPANARAEYFPAAARILRCEPAALAGQGVLDDLTAAVVMTHKLSMDAEALVALAASRVQYLALLGPLSRRERVLEMAGLSEDQLPAPLAGPAGLNLGAELPEGIALSILAECHAVLQGTDAVSLSGVFSGLLQKRARA